jgi:Fe2+ transport system protein FeoA
MAYFVMQVTTKDHKEKKRVSLAGLKPHVCAVVRSIETEDEEMQRLKTLGICVGRRLEVVQSGDPFVVRVFGSCLGISASLGERVLMEICEPGHCALKEDDLTGEKP